MGAQGSELADSPPSHLDAELALTIGVDGRACEIDAPRDQLQPPAADIGGSGGSGGSGGQGDKLFAAFGSRLLNLTELREQLLALKFERISFNLSKFNHHISERFGPH